jgi:signal transduction histidine kinase/ActR/RegA family two-component response regulator
MSVADGTQEDELLRSVALQNASSILLARQRAEQELVRAKEALEVKTNELAHSLAMMRATLESTTDGILVTDQHGVVTDYNAKYALMWAVPREFMGPRPHAELLSINAGRFRDRESFLGRIDEIYSTSPAETSDVLELVDGRVFERFTKIQIVNGAIVGRVWSFRDITEARRAEEERRALLESERAARAEAERANEMKDEFLATLSHELRTPLNAILGWAQVLRRRTAATPDIQQGLDTIERNARIQTQLIEDLLDMSRITSGKLRLEMQAVEPILFVEAAIETVRPAAEAKGIRLEKMLDPGAGPISGDPNRLQQIVWNLLSNAIKFTPKDGNVKVLLERVESHIEVKVADSGMGIKPEFLPYVFDRFRQADATTTRTYGGLGLGLSIVKQLTELHGGSVLVASEGGGCGATFIVRLPLMAVHSSAYIAERAQAKAHTAALVDFKHSDLSGIKVLVVDDEADARELIARVLGECGAEVLTAGTASEALTLIERERPQVLVTDIGMPDVDGYELLKHVRALGYARGGKIPAVALTAFARSEDRTRALRAGFLAHVSKPVEPSELVATVASVTGRADEGDVAPP